MKKVVLLGLIVVGIITMGYFLAKRENSASPKSIQPSASSTATVVSSAEPTAGVTALRVGGSSLGDPKGVFTILYPADYKLDTQGDGQYLRLSKTGPSQRGQTEMYDGVIIVFESLDLSGKTLEQWVDDTIKSSTADGTLAITQPKTAVTVNGYPGFTYTTRGLGESTNLVVQKDPTSPFAVTITTAVYDPKNQGFQTQVTDMLSTLEMVK